ncbi:hypothetical protein PIB30_047284 [Stylosanthes scabra]|uniref:Uncharacterized protein n=1 Tax=Stylosanthes scabra TaxID=79078 RepID=A0ABU6UG04_9FABA|nr:hypothetical protein [Stylosanthes scabra]
MVVKEEEEEEEEEEKEEEEEATSSDSDRGKGGVGGGRRDTGGDRHGRGCKAKAGDKERKTGVHTARSDLKTRPGPGVIGADFGLASFRPGQTRGFIK